MPERITFEQALLYECHSSWWMRYVSWDWAQTLAAKYLGWKVRRKWRRYADSIAMKGILRDALEPQP